jgi:hypothetical protein
MPPARPNKKQQPVLANDDGLFTGMEQVLQQKYTKKK